MDSSSKSDELTILCQANNPSTHNLWKLSRNEKESAPFSGRDLQFKHRPNPNC